MQELESDPEWVRERDEREAKHRKRAEMLDANESSLVADLKAVGLDVDSVYDLVHSPNHDAIPVLAMHLSRDYHELIREGIIRALSVRAAKDAVGSRLIEMFPAERNPVMQFAIANALSQMYSYQDVSHLAGISEYRGLFAS